MFKCSRLNFCRSVPPEFLRSFLSNGRLDDDCRWEKVGDIVDVVIGIVDVVGDLVDVLHGGAPEGKLHLPLGQEPIPIFVNGVESSLS